MKPIVIDAFEFGQSKERRAGEVLTAELPRLARECVDTAGSLHWELAGGTHASGHAQLNVQVKGDIHLVCQRCLKPFVFGIASESVLVLTQSDAQADQVEAMLDDDTIDVIVGSKTMDVIELIEDEALLAIPQAPKHQQCAGQGVVDSGEAITIKPSPFAALKDLKH